MGTVITLASGKGGAGKTTVSVNLAIALAQFGRDVTILDADIEMANLEIHLGLDNVGSTLNKALSGEAPIQDAIYEGPNGIKVIPAGIPLEGLRGVDPERLESVFNELIGTTEILLIDAPAGLGKNVVISLASSENALLVANPDITSMADALKTRQVADKVGCNILGVVLNKSGGNSSSWGEPSVAEIETILEKKVLTVIPDDPKFKLALNSGMPAVVLFPEAPGSVAIKKLAADITGEEYTPPATTVGNGFLKKLVNALSPGGG